MRRYGNTDSIPYNVPDVPILQANIKKNILKRPRIKLTIAQPQLKDFLAQLTHTGTQEILRTENRNHVVIIITLFYNDVIFVRHRGKT